MGTPLYTTDIIPLTSRPTLTVMDDGDYFVILDTSTGRISKILKTNIMTALKITYDNTSGLTAETVQAALDELVVNLGYSDSAILALAGRLDTIEGTGYTEGSLKTHEDRLDTLEGTGEGSVKKAIDDALEQIETDKTLAVSGMAADAKVTGDKVGELKSAIGDLSLVCYKVTATKGATANASGPLVPFRAKYGDSITASSADGSTFANVQLRFYDANRTYIGYWALFSGYGKSRTFTHNEATDAYYIGITTIDTISPSDYVVINNSNVYNLEQPIENLQNSFTQLQTQVDNIENDLYEQTVVLDDDSLHEFPVSNGTDIVITTTDGTTLPEGNPYLQCYNSSGTYTQQFNCSSVYGTSRTVTITKGDVASVMMYSTPSKPIKVYVPDNSKLIVKVDEIANAIDLDAIIVDASGSGDYTSFTQAVKDSVDSGKKIYVMPGTYNIVSEYVAIWGQSAVDSMADADSSVFNGFQYGVILRNRVVEFAPGAHLVCDWTGHTVDGTHRFSALRVDYDVEIIGLDLDVTATFYCIHDDYGLEVPYTVTYDNCRVVGHSIINANCIGGGCKKYSRHILKNSYFDNNLTGSATVRYHNTNAEGAEPEIYVSNCYFNNWFTPRWYGSQTTKMRVYVNNCKARSIHKLQESISYTTDNVELYKWCNEETDPVT
jgi:hypothetical protein